MPYWIGYFVLLSALQTGLMLGLLRRRGVRRLAVKIDSQVEPESRV
jgi:hypothetical protein